MKNLFLTLGLIILMVAGTSMKKSDTDKSAPPPPPACWVYTAVSWTDIISPETSPGDTYHIKMGIWDISTTPHTLLYLEYNEMDYDDTYTKFCIEEELCIADGFEEIFLVKVAVERVNSLGVPICYGCTSDTYNCAGLMALDGGTYINVVLE